jgi:hypothetical protein
MNGHWNLKDTVYLEPSWKELYFFLSWQDSKCSYQYEQLRKAHEATLLERGCGLVAVLVTPNKDEIREEVKNTSSKWHQTFEDAIEAVVSRVQEQIVKDRNQVVGALLGIVHYRKEAELGNDSTKGQDE